MKLINTISRKFLISSFIIFLIFSGLLYIVIEQTIIEEIDEQLLQNYDNIYNNFLHHEQVNFPPYAVLTDQNTLLGFSDVMIKSNKENEDEPFRQYVSKVNENGKEYFLIVRSSVIEKDEMLFSIFTATIIAFSIFLIFMFFINKYVSKNILTDFYTTLNQLDKFSISDEKELELQKSDIFEFNKLNETIEKLSQKAINEYKSLKEFTEETNHEIQTPVAVAKSKLEILLQSDHLGENELSQISAALSSLNKLERINKSILLLNKLEHKNLFNDSQINIKDEILNSVKSFSEFIDLKNISFISNLNDNFTIAANQSLINILISNLLSNAIKHNIDEGQINIKLFDKTLILSNTFDKKEINAEKFFDRFYKSKDNTDSIGLGLTIAKKICDIYKIDIRNYVKSGFYSIELNFKNAISIK